MLRLPKTATAPFCPSEVQGTIPEIQTRSFWRKLARFVGPGMLVSVGYMDPGNWATDIEGGSRFGTQLLFVVVLASIAAMVLQCLSMRLGIATGKDLAQHSRLRYGAKANLTLWALAEVSIIACDLAEVLGSALAFHLLLRVSLPVGVLLTALDTLVVLGLKGRSFRQIEAIIFALVLIIGGCFAVELLMFPPAASAVVEGLIPTASTFTHTASLYLAIGILGATVMPHNLYLHSSIVQTREVTRNRRAIGEAIALSRTDTIVSLLLALFINAAILVLASTVFHRPAGVEVADIEQAYRLLEPLAGPVAAGVLFAVALLASGQSSTFTGTIAGQVIMDGFLDIKIPCWQRRLITRALALVPAFVGVMMLGPHAVGRLLVFSQVILSLQLPFAIYPLIRLTSDAKVMGPFVNAKPTQWIAWFLFVTITAANAWLVVDALA